MLTKKKMLFAGCAMLGFCSFGATTLVPEADADADNTEVLTDRCSGEVAFTSTYGATPLTHGTVVLKRGHDGYSPASTFTVAPNASTSDVRWWCHSTIGNTFDPGTWKVKFNDGAYNACLASVALPIETDKINLGQCTQFIKVSSTAFDGWTPEQSRCKNKSGHLRARLGPDRLLTTECLAP